MSEGQKNRDNTTDAIALEKLQWLPTDLFLLNERRSALAKLCKGCSKKWQALRRAAIGAMETILEDLRWVHDSAEDARPVSPT